MFSVNKEAMKMVKKIIEDKESLNIGVSSLKNGSTVIDMGINYPGGWKAAQYLTEITMGGLGLLNYDTYRLGELELPQVNIYADKPVIRILNKIKYPYNVSRLTQNAALEMLDRIEEKDMWVRSILNQKSFLYKTLNQFKFVRKIYPSDANFFLVKVDDPIAIYHFLESDKLIIRNRSKMPLCENCLRITVGTEIENKMLINKLREYQEVISK